MWWWYVGMVQTAKGGKQKINNLWLVSIDDEKKCVLPSHSSLMGLKNLECNVLSSSVNPNYDVIMFCIKCDQLLVVSVDGDEPHKARRQQGDLPSKE